MITISVASGKGGAGKTSIAAAIASMLGHKVIFADCDVDAANGAIALGAVLKERSPYSAGPGFVIDPGACSGCGLCQRACRFDAVRKEVSGPAYKIVEELCERCGACLDVCPASAIMTPEKVAGELFVSVARSGIPLVHAELVPGEDTSGKLVRKVREKAEALAMDDSMIVVDAPPGIGCPVIASLSGSDIVVVVVESSASGIRDAGRLMELVMSMKRKSIAIINKSGLDGAMDSKARRLIDDAGLPLAGDIPFDTALRSAEEKGLTWLDIGGGSAIRIATALGAIRGLVESMIIHNKSDQTARKETI